MTFFFDRLHCILKLNPLAESMNPFSSLRFPRPRTSVLLGAVWVLLTGSTTFAQKTTKAAFEFPDRTVTILVPESVTVERAEGGVFRLKYKVEDGVDAEAPANRIFVEVKNTYKTPQKATSATLDMAPFDREAILHVWNPDDRCAYVTFDGSNPMVDLNNINYKGGGEKFSGDVKAVSFSAKLSLDPGEHVVEIRKFFME